MEKKGLSAVVTTLIIILLVLVAVGGIWIVVSNFIDTGTEQIDLSSRCRAVDLSAVSVVLTGGTDNYDITLKRGAGGDTIQGVKLNLFGPTGNSGVFDFTTPIAELETETDSFAATGADNANRMEYTAFFLDASGAEELCSITKTFDF